MGRCSVEKLKDLRSVLAKIRRWPQIVEPRPAVFYIKRVPFLHFHEKDGKRWADIKRGSQFVSLDLPFHASTKELRTFLEIVRNDYRKGIP